MRVWYVAEKTKRNETVSRALGVLGASRGNECQVLEPKQALRYLDQQESPHLILTGHYWKGIMSSRLKGFSPPVLDIETALDGRDPPEDTDVGAGWTNLFPAIGTNDESFGGPGLTGRLHEWDRFLNEYLWTEYNDELDLEEASEEFIGMRESLQKFLESLSGYKGGSKQVEGDHDAHVKRWREWKDTQPPFRDVKLDKEVSNWLNYVQNEKPLKRKEISDSCAVEVLEIGAVSLAAGQPHIGVFPY